MNAPRVSLVEWNVSKTSTVAGEIMVDARGLDMLAEVVLTMVHLR